MTCPNCEQKKHDTVYGMLGIVDRVLCHFPAICRACWVTMWGTDTPSVLPAWRPEYNSGGPELS